MPREKEGMSPYAHGPIGQYYLLDKIAQGGMAEIYKGLAYDLHGIKRTVVIKKILPNIAADKEYVNMLIGEAKTAVMLNHGNIAQVYDLGKVGEDYFMVMEFVDGKSLSQIHKACVKRGELIPLEYVCYFISEVASGLNYMHRKTDDQGRLLNIIHRDISPQNIIVSYSGTIKIIDFGIAKAAIKIDITESGVLKGKFAYMSPEHARGDSIDHRADIFSLGVILHETLTGRRLFKAQNARETLRNVRACKVPPPSSLRSDLPPELDRIALKALANDRDKRYFFASEIRDDLVKFLYNNFPNFSPAKVSEFIKELFANQIEEAKELEDEAKTPLLIIDRTQSAIADQRKLEETGLIKAPAYTQPFFTEEEIKKSEEVEEISEQTPSVPPDSLPKERKPLKELFKEAISRITSWLKKHGGLVKKIIPVSALIIALVLLATAAYKKGWIGLPSLPQKESTTPAAELMIDTDPIDSQVFLDGKLISEKSPIAIGRVSTGTEHTLAVQKNGYIPYTELLNLSPNEQRSIKVKLTPSAPLTGTAIIESNPSGATVYLNDTETKFKTPVSISDLNVGNRYKISVYLENYKYWTAEFDVKPGQTERFKVELTPDYGSLQIISSPPHATIKLNGEIAGTTPYKNTGMRPGNTYEVEVGKENYSTWTEKIKILPGKEILLNPVLELLNKAAPSEPLPPPVPTPPKEEASGTPSPGASAPAEKVAPTSKPATPGKTTEKKQKAEPPTQQKKEPARPGEMLPPAPIY